MAWVAWSDTAAGFPPLMNVALLPEADDRLVNEVMGFLFRLAQWSAQHWTDYVVPLSVAQQYGGSRSRLLIDACKATGLLADGKTKDDFPALVLIQNRDFFNIILEQDRGKKPGAKADWALRDPFTKMMVIHRDGDNCRWCGVPVHWEGRKSLRTGELDHLNPGEPGTVDTLVVACRSCNGARQDRGEEWSKDHPLLSPPRKPVWGAYAVREFEKLFGEDWESRVAEVATSARKSEGASERPREVDSGGDRYPVSVGPDRVDSGTEGPRSSSAPEGPKGGEPGESNRLPLSTPKVDSGAASARDSQPHRQRTELSGNTANAKPVYKGREGKGSGPGWAGPGWAGLGRVGPGGVPPVSQSEGGKRKRRRGRKPR